MGAKLLNVKATDLRIKKVQKEHSIVMKKGLAAALTVTRIKAKEHLISNSTGTYNPYRARKAQPNTSGRLTSRTGKLGLMLKNGASATNPLKGWTPANFSTKIAKQTSNMLHSMVRELPGGQYKGTIRVQGRGGDPRLFDTKRGQPAETLRTLAVRFNWETGIRGSSRPIFKPVAKETNFHLHKLVKENNAKIWRM